MCCLARRHQAVRAVSPRKRPPLPSDYVYPDATPGLNKIAWWFVIFTIGLAVLVLIAGR